MADDTLGSLMVAFSADISGVVDAVSQIQVQFASLGGAADEAGIAMSEGLAQGATGASTLIDISEQATMALDALAPAGQEAGAAVAQGLEEADNAMQTFSEFANGAKKSMSDVGAAASDAGQGANSFAGNMGNMIQQGWLNITMLQSLGQQAINTAQALIDPAAQAEQTGVAFDTLMGNTQDAEAELSKLNTFSAQTPFQTQDIDTAASKMLAFGFNAQSIIPDVTAIGDSLSALGEATPASLQSIVDIFGKIQASGKLTAVDMMQLSSWGIPAWQALSKAMGLPVPELQKMVSKGTIPASEAIDKLRQGMEDTFGGGMAKQAQTYNGLMSTLQSNIKMAWDSFLGVSGGQVQKGSLFAEIESGLNAVGNVVANPKFQAFAQMIGSQIVPSIQKFGTFLSSSLLPPLEHLEKVMEPIVTPIVKWAVQNDVLHKSLQGVGLIVQTTIVDFGKLIDGIASVIEFFQKNQLAADILVGVLGGLAAVLLVLAGMAIIDFLSTLPLLIFGFAVWTVGALSAAAATLAATWPFILLGIIVAAVIVGVILAIQHWSEITQWFGNLWHSVWTGVSTFFTGLWDNIVKGVENALGWIGHLFQQIGPDLYNFFIQPFVDGWNTISKIFSGIGQLLNDVVHLNFGAIPGDLSNIGIPGFANGVQNFSGGLAMVGENGPELVSLPRGSNVYPTGTMPPLQGSSGQPQHIVIMLDGQTLGEALGNTQQQQIYLRTGVKVA